ncbi:uncharacterized protein LOC135320260 [Camelus dromedarius]|uniref:uncharacterized protein LOC135320260 n=1 Tax=Camelus dromedarius TaxID=9838 RepID=UPI00311A3D31
MRMGGGVGVGKGVRALYDRWPRSARSRAPEGREGQTDKVGGGTWGRDHREGKERAGRKRTAVVGKGVEGGTRPAKNSRVGGNNGRGNSDGGSHGSPTLGTFLNEQRQLGEKRRPGSARRGSEKSGEGGEGGGGGGGEREGGVGKRQGENPGRKTSSISISSSSSSRRRRRRHSSGSSSSGSSSI